MSLHTLKLNSDYSYKFTTILEQVTYQMRFNWIEKEDAWYLDLYDRGGEPLVLGHKLLYGNIVLTKYNANTEVPQGELMLLSGTSGDLLRPTFDSVSTGDILYYISSDELE